MKKIGIFFGSSSGNTEKIAYQIQNILGKENTDVFNVANANVELMDQYENLILGTSTWGLGDLQDDWEGFVSALKKINFNNKKVALFGLGDSSIYSDTFVDGMGILYDEIKDKATIVGEVDTNGYNYDSSKAERDGKFVGLPIDEDSQSKETPTRINNWTNNLKKEFSL